MYVYSIFCADQHWMRLLRSRYVWQPSVAYAKQGHRGVAALGLFRKTKLDVGKPDEVKPFRANCTVVIVKKCNYGIAQKSEAILWPYHVFHINESCEQELSKQENTKRDT